MEFSTLSNFIIVGFFSIQHCETDSWNEVYVDFNKILEESSEMCDRAIQHFMRVVSDKKSPNIWSVECLQMLFDMKLQLINQSKSLYEKNEACFERPSESVAEILLFSNLKECLNMMLIKEQLEIIYDEMVQSGKEISWIKDEFPGIVEGNCSGEEDEESCKLEIALSFKPHVTDLLLQASANTRILKEVVNAYREKAIICFESWENFEKIQDEISELCISKF